MTRIPLGYKLVLDVSHHVKLDYELISKQVDGIILRVAFGITKDTKFEEQYAGFKSCGVPMACFQWFRPDQDIKAQIEVVKTALINKDIRMVFSDQEQQGMYGVPLHYYSQALLSERCRAHVTGLQTHGFEVGVYTRATWVSQYAKANTDWLYDYEVWLASWPFSKEAITCSWDVLKSTWAPAIFSPYVTSDWPRKIDVAGIWQWSGDKFILPGIYTQTGIQRTTDLNYVSDAVFARFTKPAVIEPPAPPVNTEADALRARITNIHNELTDLDNELHYIVGLTN